VEDLLLRMGRIERRLERRQRKRNGKKSKESAVFKP
jgi:hypothetical protein